MAVSHNKKAILYGVGCGLNILLGLGNMGLGILFLCTGAGSAMGLSLFAISALNIHIATDLGKKCAKNLAKAKAEQQVTVKPEYTATNYPATNYPAGPKTIRHDYASENNPYINNDEKSPLLVDKKVDKNASSFGV